MKFRLERTSNSAATLPRGHGATAWAVWKGFLEALLKGSGRVRVIEVLVIVALASAPPFALAQPSPDSTSSFVVDDPLLIVKPNWTRRPTGEDMARLYPDAALPRLIGSRVVIGCKVTAPGLLGDCIVLEEERPGFGFGEATIQLAKKFAMRPTLDDGSSVEGRHVRVPVRWTLS